jgi:SSS family solute:Na+ symporter
MAILFVANMIIMLIIGKIWPRDEPFVLEYTKKVDIKPYRYVNQVGLAVCAIVIGIYIYFAK